MAANTRFAVAAHVVALLASKDGRCIPSSEIAASVNTNPVVIRRIVAALAKAGIVESQKGKTGGTRLKRRPEEISLWELYAALGEKLFAVHRNPANPRCPLSCHMKETLLKAFSGAEEAAREALRRVTVKDLLER
jgi:Rrf2 family protein